jgi:hypothetical protein
MESEGYIEKKSKFMQQVGRQRQYCGTGWSAEGVKFYKDEWKKWKTISSGSTFGLWKQLEAGWEGFSKEDKFGCIAYSSANMPNLNDNSKSTTSDNQEKCLPANHVSLDGEEHFETGRPWENKRSLHSRDDEERKDTSTHKKARRTRTVPWVSRDSTASLSQGSSRKLSSEMTKLKNVMTTIIRKTP